jgi:hypothetical protein
MRKIIILFIAILPLMKGCSSSEKKERKAYKGFMVESHWLDSIPSGVTTFYDEQGRLYSKVNYINGLRQGWGVFYNKQGDVNDSTYYKNDLAEGPSYSFNEAGELISKTYYVKGFSFGPMLLYKDKKLTEYHFWTFDQKLAFTCTYSSQQEFVFTDRPFHVTTYKTTIDNGEGLGIFAYMAFPPEANCNYDLIERSSKNNSEKILRTFQGDIFFVDTSILTKPDFKYYFRAIYSDSTGNIGRKAKVIMTELN